MEEDMSLFSGDMYTLSGYRSVTFTNKGHVTSTIRSFYTH